MELVGQKVAVDIFRVLVHAEAKPESPLAAD